MENDGQLRCARDKPCYWQQAMGSWVSQGVLL